MDEEFIKFLGRATAYLFMLSLAALSAGRRMKILAVIGAFAIMILFAFVCGAIIAQQTDDEKIREDLEQEECLSKLKSRKEKKK